ncbi:protein phosphatase (plasmid) [Streptomyces lunaelactis]|uniref:Protein phosphatase n=1 Tax=Streptomyces lunaelactis TaxID=1535768 RepID=A0A2R4TFP8_9ACTN|nr:SpoIIE family protein phosphatase [Streptomyces lunaelactis]AVZ77934.1 protein phosphatase [Streptomyces lunaelactis]NUK83405.1 SpoIIE family protein phosphatase [Streptomyces lunaelactis]
MYDPRFHDPEYHDAAGVLPEPGDETYAVLDERGVLTAWSPGAERLLGYTAPEVRGCHGGDLLHSGPEADALADRWGRGDVIEIGQAVLRHRSGHGVVVALRAHLLVSPAGERQWLIRATDAETARREELGAALLRGLFAESPFLIDVFDRQLRFVAQNDTQRRTTGFAGADFTGRTMAEVAPAGLMDMDAFEARQRQVLQSGEPLFRTEVHGHTPADPGREHVWSESILPLRGNAGEVIALAHAVVDVTERVRARERLALVNEASTQVGTTLDALRTAQELCEVAVPVFADHAGVSLLDPVPGGQEQVPGPAGEALPLRRAAVATGPQGAVAGAVEPSTPGADALFTRVMAEGEPLLLTREQLAADLERSDPRAASAPREGDARSWLLVPLSARGVVLGTVEFVRTWHTHAFDADDVLLAQEIVARAAVCIDNARRYARERTTALALQRSLLPRLDLPALGAVEVVPRRLPADGRPELGGAWFDVIPLSGARVALVVGEVPGPGLHAAVTMGRLRTAVRTLADLDLSPEEVLTHLDDQVKRFRDEYGERGDALAGGAAGTTCVYVVFDPVSRMCHVARAGHPPPARATADGQVEMLDLPGGPPLGLGGALFESGEVILDDGDLLLLYTEGLVRPREGSTDAEPGPLCQALSDATLGTSAAPSPPGGGLDALCDRMIGRLPATRPDDDVALLAVRVHGLDSDQHVTWDVPADPEAVGRTRGLASRKLAEWGLENLQFTTEIVVSELVTNAIRYGTEPIRLRMIRDRNLICEVSDGSSTSPHVRRAHETDEGGRGLLMVAKITRLWGTRYHARGKTIWAEQPFSGGEGAFGEDGVEAAFGDDDWSELL